MTTAKKTIPASLIAVLLTLAAGCNGTEPLQETATDKPPREKMPVSTSKHPVPHEVMDRLYAEVAKLSGYERARIALVRAETATWNDGALGCPQPNVGYTQAIVNGYWVIMRAGDEEFDYRIDSGLRHRRCTGATKQAPIRYPSDT